MNHLSANTFALSLQLLAFEFITYMGKNTFKFFINHPNTVNFLDRNYRPPSSKQLQTFPPQARK